MHVLVIGSSVIDLFMTVNPDHAPVLNGKVSFSLGDKIPSEIKKLGLGGNGSNVSVGLTRLTIPTTFYTYLGKDILSREIEEKLMAEGVELIAKRGTSENSPLHIIFDFEADRIIFSHYPKAEHKFEIDRKDFDYIFLNSIADVWEQAYEQVFDFSSSNNIPIIFSPGSRQLDNLSDTVFKVIERSHFIFMNKEEAIKILSKKGIDTSDIKKILSGLSSLGPKVVSVTDGGNGAYALDENGKAYYIEARGNNNSVDKTGAGDGYAAAFLGCVLSGGNVPDAMKWGGLNSKSVMEFIGAQPGLLNLEALKKDLENFKDYEASEI